MEKVLTGPALRAALAKIVDEYTDADGLVAVADVPEILDAALATADEARGLDVDREARDG